MPRAHSVHTLPRQSSSNLLTDVCLAATFLNTMGGAAAYRGADFADSAGSTFDAAIKCGFACRTGQIKVGEAYFSGTRCGRLGLSKADYAGQAEGQGKGGGERAVHGGSPIGWSGRRMGQGGWAMRLIEG